MSWWKPLLSLLGDLDEAVDRASEAFQEHVAPAVQEAAGRLDRYLEGKGVELEAGVHRTAADLDERWQRFMVRRVDPLLAQIQSEPLAEVDGRDIGPEEAALNRRIALSGAAFIAIAVGGALFPASRLVTVPLSFGLVLPVYEEARRSVEDQGRVTYEVVYAVSVTGSWLGGYYAGMAGTMVLYDLVEKLLMVAEDRYRAGLLSVFARRPRAVWVRRDDGAGEARPLEEVARGDVVVVGAGGLVPVDGTVVEGSASIDEHRLTGEARPVERTVGDRVFATTLVRAGEVHVRVERTGDETAAAKIGAILARTGDHQLPLQVSGGELADRAAVPTLALGALALVSRGPESALAMLDSCFGASAVVSGPVAMLNLLDIASRHGILVKDGRSLETLSGLDTVVFDAIVFEAIETAASIRSEVEEALRALTDRGLHLVLMSGDEEEPTGALARRLGIERHVAGVPPEGKAAVVERLQAEGHSVCLVGDGIVDAMAMKTANASVSLRGAATAAEDAAQVVLMQESLRKLPCLFEIAGDMNRSLRWSYVAGLIPGAINVAGVLLLGWGFYPALFLELAGLSAGVVIAMAPWYEHRQSLARAGVPPEAATAAPVEAPALPARTASGPWNHALVPG